MTEQDQPEQTGSVTRTYRAALRFGDNYITLEETITLPQGASDEDIQAAVALGWRIYRAQHEAMENQLAHLHDMHQATATPTIRNPDAPASDKQRNLIAYLQQDLGWHGEQLASYAASQGVSLVDITKGQASGFIDGLKRLVEERAAYHQDAAPSTSSPSTPSSPLIPEGGTHGITERQYDALVKLAQGRNVDLETEAQQHFGVSAREMSYQQASDLIKQWQRHKRPTRQ